MTITKHLFLSAFISLVLATSSEAQIKVKSGEKVAFLGDSITQFGWDRPGGYVHLVAEGLESAGVKIVPIPAGVSGNTSHDMIGRVDASVISKKPDWMTLSCGANDVLHGANGGVELEPYKANITAIVDKAQAAGIKVMILTSTLLYEGESGIYNQKVVAYNDFLRQLAKERNLPLVDLNNIFWKAVAATPRPHLTVDGIHMSPEGNILMARGVLEGFGLSTEQVDAFEKTWRQAPDAATVVAQLGLTVAAPVSLKNYAAIGPLAAERKIPQGELQSRLLFEALRAVLKAHDQDATLTLVEIQDELQKAFSQKIDEALNTPAK